MAEPTLALKVADIQAKLGTFAGWGRGALFGDPSWTSYQQAVIDDATQSGLRRFYFCDYDWSFLKPVASLLFLTSATQVTLPDDFGGVEGQITVQATSQTSMPWPIEWRNSPQIRAMYAVTPSMTGPPMYAALESVKGTSATTGQRWVLLVFPGADQLYTLQLNYYVNPDYLTTSNPYAYGGPQHVETILESCLAAMEQKLDDAASTHTEVFMRMLEMSKAVDRRTKPQKLGLNRDNSDQNYIAMGRDWVHYYAPATTYNGQTFG